MPSKSSSDDADNKKDSKLRKCTGCEREFNKKDLNRCSGCNIHYYCSAQCQKKDWPTHKPICNFHKTADDFRKDQQDVANPYTNTSKRGQRLCRQWYKKITSPPCAHLLQELASVAFRMPSSLGDGKIIAMEQPPKHIIQVGLSFDFNNRTFVPTNSTIQPVMGIPRDLIKTVLAEMRTTDFQKDYGSKGLACHWVILTISELDMIYPTKVTLELAQLLIAAPSPVVVQQKIQQECILSSSIFSKWEALLHDCHEQFFQTLVSDKLYRDVCEDLYLVVMVLLDLNQCSKNKTHHVVVQVEHGKKLGRITKISSCECKSNETLLSEKSVPEEEEEAVYEFLRQEEDTKDASFKAIVVIQDCLRAESRTAHLLDLSSYCLTKQAPSASGGGSNKKKRKDQKRKQVAHRNPQLALSNAIQSLQQGQGLPKLGVAPSLDVE